MCFSLSFSRLCQNILSRPSPKNAEGVTFISIQIQFQVESFHTCPSCSLSSPMNLSVMQSKGKWNVCNIPKIKPAGALTDLFQL